MPLEVKMALGRIFRLMSRPEQPGDIEQYFKARSVILNAADASGIVIHDTEHSWVRDRHKGAQGD